MIGKKNIVFGFLFLVFTAGLGPYMVLMYQDQEPGSFIDSSTKKQQQVGRLQELKTNNFEEDLEELESWLDVILHLSEQLGELRQSISFYYILL